MPIDLWNTIRDFFVHYLFGGYDSSSIDYGGYFTCDSNDIMIDGAHIYYDTGFTTPDWEGGYVPVRMSIGDWLSTTATIIVMILIMVFAIWLVRWIFKLVSSAFLLRR